MKSKKSKKESSDSSDDENRKSKKKVKEKTENADLANQSVNSQKIIEVYEEALAREKEISAEKLTNQ